MTPVRFPGRLAAASGGWVLLLVVLTACQQPTGPDLGDPVTETVTPAGGTVSATDLAGNQLSVDFPPAAVPEPTEVTLTPGQAPAGAWASFTIEPAGTPLALPATLRLEAAPGTDVSGSGLRFGTGVAGTALPTTVDPDRRTLEAETTFLGFPEEGDPALNGQQGGLDPLIAWQIQCDIEFTSLEIRFEQARNFPFSSSASAKQLADQIASFRQTCAGLQPNYDALISRIQTEACQELNDAEADAAVTPPTTRDELLELARKIMNWAAAAEGASAPCTSSWLGSVEALFADFIARFRAKVNGPDYFTDYNDIWNDLRLGAMPLLGDTMRLDLSSAMSAVEDLIADLLDGLRTAGYRACVEEDTQSLLANLYTGGNVRSIPVSPPPTVPLLAPQQASQLLLQYANFTQTELEEDMQVCGSRVTLEVWKLTESFPDKNVTVEGGATAGNHTRSAETQAPVEGQLQLSGELLAMDCPTGPDSADLVLELDGTEVERLAPTGATFPLGNAELDVETMLAQAGIDASNQANLKNPYPLQLIREGSPCGGDYGADDYPVFTFEVQFDPAPDITADPSSSTPSIPAESDTAITFTLPFEDVGENVTKIIARFSLAGNPTVFPFEWAVDAPEISGFGGASGNGTVTTGVFIFCSEAGKNPVTAAFTLEDEFEQQGQERNTTLMVDYSGC